MALFTKICGCIFVINFLPDYTIHSLCKRECYLLHLLTHIATVLFKRCQKEHTAMNCFDDAVQFWQNLRLHLLKRGPKQDFEIVEHQSKVETRYTFHTTQTLVPNWWTISVIFFPENGTYFFPELPSAFRSSDFQSTF